MAIEKAPKHGGRETLTAIGDQTFLYFQQRHVWPAANETEQILIGGGRDEGPRQRCAGQNGFAVSRWRSTGRAEASSLGLAGHRLVLDQLHQVVAIDDLAGRDRHVSPDLERLRSCGLPAPRDRSNAPLTARLPRGEPARRYYLDPSCRMNEFAELKSTLQSKVLRLRKSLFERLRQISDLLFGRREIEGIVLIDFVLGERCSLATKPPTT